MKHNDYRDKLLIGILVAMALLVAGLIIGIIAVKIHDNTSSEKQEQEAAEAEEYFEAAVNNDVYILTEDLAKIYNDGDKEKATLEYKTNIDQALEQEDYSKFFRLLASASVAMTNNEDCARLMDFYDSIDENKLPPSQRVDFYGTAGSYCASCGDTARQASYEAKAQQLYNSGEAEDYEN